MEEVTETPRTGTAGRRDAVGTRLGLRTGRFRRTHAPSRLRFGREPGDVRVLSGATKTGADPATQRLPRRVLAGNPAGRRVGGDRGLQHLFEGSGWSTLRLLADLLAGVVAVALALGTLSAPAAVVEHPWVFAFPLVLVLTLHLRGLYRRTFRAEILDCLAPLAGAVSVAAMALLGLAVFVFGDLFAGHVVGRVWGAALVLVILGRAVLSLLKRYVRRHRLVGKPTLIVGAGMVGEQIARRLEQSPEYGLRPVAFLDADPLTNLESDGRIPVLGVPDEVALVAARTHASHVIFAFTGEPDHGLTPLARRCEALGLEVSIVPRFFESINDRMQLERLGSLPLFGLRTIDPQGWQFGVKYALDRIAGGLLLLLAGPIMLATALAVRTSSPGPVLFRQQRVGRDGQHFDLLKFRSMRVAEDDGGFELRSGVAPGGIEGVDRRTPIGRILRRYALDELPQLINVVRGEMSLVGPRPERPEFVDRFGRDITRYQDRHRVKSGITGWAQVSGLRGQTSLQDRIEWDNVYIENWSLWFDVKILLLTAGAVLRTGDDA